MTRSLSKPLPQRGPATSAEAARPRDLRRFLSAHAVLPAVLLSLAATAMLQLRLRWSDSGSFLFMTWNLALGWAPYLLGLAAALLDLRSWGRLWNLGPLWALSLLFLPNAPYLVTDLIHLKARPGVPLWFDALMLFLYGATGWLLGLATLHGLKVAVERRLGTWAANSFVIAAAFASGFGVYLGRVWRFNSWDLLTVPGLRLHQIAAQLRAPAAHPEMVLLTLAVGGLLVLTFAAFERHLAE